MKNNKGYTLVELLVTLAVFAIIMAEVGNMMINSSKLYLNGTYEVELQTEAQQLVQQMEEMLIDVNHSISVEYKDALGSDFITVSNNSMIDGTGDYTIYNFTVDKDPELGYGTLYFNKTSSDGSADVTGIPMAEYVQSISLNMAEYEHDVVTLSVSMNNGKYSYQTSQDIYLRNGVGSGGGYNYANGGSFKAELNVLRFKDYDLAKLFNTDDHQYTYAWDATCVAQASTIYDLTNPNDPTGAELSVSPTYNGRDEEFGPFTLIGTSTTNPSNQIRIKVGTDPMGNGSVVIFQNTASTYATMSPAVVKGINIDSDKITEITANLVYMKYDSTEPEKIPLDFNSSYSELQFQYNPTGADPGGRIDFNLKGLSFGRNGNDNTVEVTSSELFMNPVNLWSMGVERSNAYNFYIDRTSAPIYIDLIVKYGSVQELHMKLYLLPTPGVVDPMSEWDGVSEKFWGAAGYS